MAAKRELMNQPAIASPTSVNKARVSEIDRVR